MAGLFFLAGCMPSTPPDSDERKEAHFLAGAARVRAMDYNGAIEEFEKALEVNPRNASAHFELAWLYEKDEKDLVGAIYHYDRYLRLRPNAPNAETARARLLRCKQLLAATVTPMPTTPTLQREVERLTAENRELRRQLETLQAHLASYVRTGAPPSQPMGPVQPRPAQLGQVPQQPQLAQQAPPQLTPAERTAPGMGQSADSARPGGTYQKHTVQRGESPYSIARKYGVSLDALMRANPGLNPQRLRVGQVINVPTQ